VGICIVIARTALSTARLPGIGPVAIIVIIVDYLIKIQWSNGQEVAWLILPVAWRLNLCPEIIGAITRETLAGEINLSRARCQRIAAIHLISECTGVVLPLIVHVVTGFVKHMPHM